MPAKNKSVSDVSEKKKMYVPNVAKLLALVVLAVVCVMYIIMQLV